MENYLCGIGLIVVLFILIFHKTKPFDEEELLVKINSYNLKQIEYQKIMFKIAELNRLTNERSDAIKQHDWDLCNKINDNIKSLNP